MAMPALLMRTSSVSTSSTARWICEPLVTSSVRGVTRSSGCCRAPRVPAYTFFAPRRSASSRRARPIPRLAPVIKTDLFEIFMTFSFVDSPFEFRTSETQAENPFPLLHLVGLRRVHISTYLFVVSLCPAAHASERSDDCPSQPGQGMLGGDAVRSLVTRLAISPVASRLRRALGVTSCPGFFF